MPPTQLKRKPPAKKGKRRGVKSSKTALHKEAILCGAKTRSGGQCRARAGLGTTHLGIGRCRLHGGNAPPGRKAAIVKEAVQFMGAPKEINPLDAIVWCIRITAGEVEWLSLKIAEVDQADWFEDTPVGKQMHILQRARADAQDRLVRYSKDAISLGLAERAIRLAENFGMAIAKLLEGIAAELQLNAAQKRHWPAIVRKQLILMEGQRVVNERDYEAVAELEERAGGRR